MFSVTARALGTGSRSSVLSGYRIHVGDRTAVLALAAVHVMVGDERTDERLREVLGTTLDGLFGDLRHGAPPGEALDRAHAWAVREQFLMSAIAARVDGQTMTAARAGLAQVIALSPQRVVVFSPELLPLDVRPPILASALGAPKAQPARQLTADVDDVLLFAGDAAPADNLPNLSDLAHAQPHPVARGAIVVGLQTA